MLEGRIRALAICLFTNGERILVSTHYDPEKQDHFCRPLGGGIEFGERSHDAIVREIKEETNFDIEEVKLLGVLENLFGYAGMAGHEVVFVFDARFKDASIYDQNEVRCCETGYADFSARWRTLEEIVASGDRLVPEGILDLIPRMAS